MSHWKRAGFGVHKSKDNLTLLPFQVVLDAQEWASRPTRGTYGDTKIGKDQGGVVSLCYSLHQRLKQLGVFNRYIVQRRARKELFVGAFDAQDQPIFCQAGETYHPRTGKPDDYGRVGAAYDMVISFATPLEAVTFRMMVQGIS